MACFALSCKITFALNRREETYYPLSNRTTCRNNDCPSIDYNIKKSVLLNLDVYFLSIPFERVGYMDQTVTCLLPFYLATFLLSNCVYLIFFSIEVKY